VLPLGNGILKKMWQHFLEWTRVDGWSNGVTLITYKRQQTKSSFDCQLGACP
jgi:hypothetical protein